MPSPSALALRAKRLIFRALRKALLTYARAEPRDRTGAERRVKILLTSAWGMGGTIRAAHNTAQYLAANGYDVELISVWRRREEPFFGSFPPGVRAVAMDDVRPGAAPRGWGLIRRVLRTRSSVLYHPADRNFPMWNLWVDLQIVRKLRRQSGVLIATRPGLNMLAADLALPGFVTIGMEQMNLSHHVKTLRQAMPSRYPKLDAFVVLTDQDMESYDRLLKGRARLYRIPNTVHDATEPKADLSAKTVLAAGRFVYQKGFDMLVEAWAPVAARYPDWTLKICGHGEWRHRIDEALAAHGDAGVVLAPPAEDLPGEMSRASIYVLSSRFEGFPLVLLEAMGKEMAVAAFDCPTGPRDIIDDHENGLIVPAEDVPALSKAIMELVEDEELRRRCAAAAGETAQRFTVNAVGPQWTALIEELTGSGTPRAAATELVST